MAVVALINTAGGAMEAALKLGIRVCSTEYQGTRPPCDIRAEGKKPNLDNLGYAIYQRPWL